MTEPFRPSALRRTPRPAPARAPRPAAKGLGPGTKIVLFLGVVYLVVWPALSLYLLTLAARGLCLLPGAEAAGCGDWLALKSALPAWAARLMGGALLLLFALSFWVRSAKGSFRGMLLWGFRGACVLSPAVVGIAGAAVPVPFPLAFLVGLWQPPVLGVALGLLGLSLVLVWLAAALAFLGRRYKR